MGRGFVPRLSSRFTIPQIQHRSVAEVPDSLIHDPRELFFADSIFAGTLDAGLIRAGTLNALTVQVINLYANNINRGTVPLAQLPASATGSIADGAITELKLAARAVGSTRIALGAVGSELVANAAIYRNKIAAEAITSSKIAAGTVLGLHIKALNITGDKIAANAISAAKVTVGTLVTLSAQIIAGIINTSHIGSLSADKVKAGTFYGGNFIVGTQGMVKSSDFSRGTTGWALTYNKGLEIYRGSIVSNAFRNRAVTNTQYSSGYIGLGHPSVWVPKRGTITSLVINTLGKKIHCFLAGRITSDSSDAMPIVYIYLKGSFNIWEVIYPMGQPFYVLSAVVTGTPQAGNIKIDVIGYNGAATQSMFYGDLVVIEGRDQK